MKTLTSRFAALVAALSLLPAAFAQDAAKPADAAPASKAAKAEKAKPDDDGVTKAGKPFPFHGTVVSVDKKAMTFTPWQCGAPACSLKRMRSASLAGWRSSDQSGPAFAKRCAADSGTRRDRLTQKP